MTSIKPVKLNTAAQQAFDRYQREKLAVSKARKHEDSQKQAKAELAAAFGDAQFGEFPDGRIVQRITKTQKRKAQPARETAWDDFQELSTT